MLDAARVAPGSVSTFVEVRSAPCYSCSCAGEAAGYAKLLLSAVIGWTFRANDGSVRRAFICGGCCMRIAACWCNFAGNRKTWTQHAASCRRPAQLHIEQGPELEANGTSLGIVTAIAAPAALRVRFSGDGGHAGAQLMPRRRAAGPVATAALCAAARPAWTAPQGSGLSHWRAPVCVCVRPTRARAVLLPRRAGIGCPDAGTARWGKASWPRRLLTRPPSPLPAPRRAGTMRAWRARSWRWR